MTQAKTEQFSISKNNWETILFAIASNQRAVAFFKQVPPDNVTINTALAAMADALNETRRQGLIISDELNDSYEAEIP